MSLRLIERPKKIRREDPPRRPPPSPLNEPDMGYVMLAIVICSCIGASVLIGLYVLIWG